VVFSFSIRTRLALPSICSVTFSSLMPRSTAIIVPAVRTAMQMAAVGTRYKRVPKFNRCCPTCTTGYADLNHVLVEVRLGDLASGIPESVSPPGDRAAI
jgi:hypothetical protein